MAPLKDLLPNISIKPDISPEDFISKIAEIAESVHDIEYKLSRESDSSVLSLSLTFKKAVQHGPENLYGLFAIRPCDDKRVWIELSSTTWATSPLSYGQYVQLVKQLLGPFLKKYNKQYKTRRRFHIPKKEHLEPRLSPIISKVFDRFVNSANKTFLHPNDWRNFYSLVRACHNRRASLAAEELERLLLKEGFSEYYVGKLSCIYEHGRRILRKEFYPEHIKKIILSDEYIEKRRRITSQFSGCGKPPHCSRRYL
jgi:hypothetical protein